jgi:hypothetical protein
LRQIAGPRDSGGHDRPSAAHPHVLAAKPLTMPDGAWGWVFVAMGLYSFHAAWRALGTGEITERSRPQRSDDWFSRLFDDTRITERTTPSEGRPSATVWASSSTSLWGSA